MKRTQHTTLGKTLNSEHLRYLLQEQKFEPAIRFLDKALKDIRRPHQDPHYIPFMEVLATCLIKDGCPSQADAVLDRLRGKVNIGRFSRTLESLDIQLRRQFARISPNFYLAAPPEEYTTEPPAVPKTQVSYKPARKILAPPPPAEPTAE